MKPQVVLKEEDTNTGSQKNIGSEEVRQIVSAETSKELRDMLRSVVATGTGRNAEVKGFSVGGKSGTSEPDYSDKTAEYIASFMGVAPTTDPEYAVLVIIRAPKGKSRQGGQVAAPVVSQILKDIFTNTKLVTNAERTEANANEIKTKDFVGKTVKEVNEIAKAEGINVVLNSKNLESKVTKQLPRAGTIIDKSGKIYLNTDDSESIKQVEVPDLKKKTKAEVISILNARGLNVNIDGTEGVVMIQDPNPGQTVDTGNVVKVTIKKELAEGH